MRAPARLRREGRRSQIPGAGREAHFSHFFGHRMSSTDRVNNNEQGWGAAAATCLLALALLAFAWYMHETTYQSPNDVLGKTAPAAQH